MPVSSGHSHATSGMQDFILTHFLGKTIAIYCGHKGEVYVGEVVDCADCILYIEKDGQKTYIACDKVESVKPQ